MIRRMLNSTRDLIVILGVAAVICAGIATALAVGYGAKSTAADAARKSAAADRHATAVATAQAAEARRVAEQAKANAAAINPVVCHLVAAYVHPVAGTDPTDRSKQIVAVWREVGVLVHCPDGEPPK